MGDQPGAGGSRSYKIRGHSRQRRSTKPYSRPSDGKKGVLETVKDFFSPSWLVDFWKGKITPEEEEVEQDEDIEEPENPTETIEIEPGSSRGTSELVNTRLAGQTSSDTRERIDKVYGNGGLGSVASAQITSQSSRKSGLNAFLALTSRHKSDKESVVTRTTGSSLMSTETWRPVDQEGSKAPASRGSASDHIDLTERESPSSSQLLPNIRASTSKDSPSISFLNPGPTRKALSSLISTSTPMPPEPSPATPMSQSSTSSERIPPSTGSRPQPTSVFRSRPEFSVAAFGSPLPPQQRTQNKRFSSPFYSGKTTFGGASSQFTKSAKRMRVSSPGSQEVSRPVKKQIKPTPIAGPGVGGVASQTAKRILETLEKMSSPLVDAKKIPPSPPSSSPLSFTQSMRRKQPHQPNRAIGSPRKLQAQFGAPPVQSLSVPQRASISRISQKTQSTRTSTITSQAQEPTSTGQLSRREISKATPTFIPTPLPMSLSPKESSKGGGKMRTAKSNTHYKSQTIAEEEEEVVNPLPEIVSAVPLSIPCSATLPTFSFSPSSSSTKISTSTSSTSKMGFSFAPSKSKQSDITSNNFKFSIPEPKASSSIASTSNQTPEKKSLYSFSRPAPVNTSDSSMTSDDGKNVTTKSMLDKYKSVEGSWECATCMINNKATATSCVACSSSKPTKTVASPSNDLFKKFAPPVGSWNCETCLVPNKSSDDKCVACQTTKPSSSKSTSTPVVSRSDDLMKKFAPVDGCWECSTCMISNRGSDSKCAACQTPKPSSSKVPVVQSDDLRKKFASAEDSWECSACMLNNKISDSKCVACQTPNPTSSQKSTSDDLMKKFATASDTWECSTCMINNKSSDNKCAACQTPKPGAESSSTSSSSKYTFGAGTSIASKFAPVSGSWTCDACMIVNKSDALKCLACETPKPGSSLTGGFNLATGKAATKSSFTFGGASTGSNTKTNLQFGTTSSKSNSSSPFTFGSNAVTTTTQPITFGGSSESKKFESSNSSSSFVFGKSVGSDSKTSDSPSIAPNFTFGAGAASTTASKPTIQFGVTAESKASDSPKKEPPAIESSVNSQQKIQFGAPAKTDDQKASSFIFGGSKPAVQFGSGSLGQSSSPKTSETPAKRQHSSIAEAAAAGLLKIPSSSPAPVVDLTEEDSTTDQAKGSAPPNVNLFQSGTQSNQMFSTATATMKSETSGAPTLPSLPFAFGGTPASKPAEEPPKSVQPFTFMAATSNTAVSTAAAPTATASPFNFASSLGSNNKALSNPTTSSLVAPQFGSFAASPVSTTVAGFPSVLNAATTSAGSGTSTFAFKGTTNTNGKFGAPAASNPPGFAFGTPLSNAASGSSSSSGGFAFGGAASASAVPTATNATSAPFVFGGGQSTSEPKPAFNFTTPNQAFAFVGSAAATQNTQVSTTSQQVPESMDADGNNNSSQSTVSVPAFGSQVAAPSATPFTFNTAPTTNTGFSFGGAQPSSTFKFGGSQAPSLGGGTLGGPAVPPAVPAFGAPVQTQPAASGGFNFGSPATNNISSAPPSGFMAGSGSGAFNAGTGGVQTKRIIKKGVRRMKR